MKTKKTLDRKKPDETYIPDCIDYIEDYEINEESCDLIESIDDVLEYLHNNEEQMRKRIGHYKFEVLAHELYILKNNLISKVENS